MDSTDNNVLDFSKFDILDMCYFLNGRADLITNNYLKGFNPLMLSKVEMYEYIKFKTDNFDKIKFQFVFDEISSYCFEYMDFYKSAKVDGKFINKYVKDYDEDYSITDKEPYKYICRTLELNRGLMVNCQQIVEFVRIAEELYKTVCESKGTPPPPAPFTAKKIIDIYDPMKVHKEFKNELKCKYETFKAWFVDGTICDKKMSWNYGNGNRTQLRSFIYNLCEGWTPKETNTAFKIVVDSNDRDTQINSDLIQRLEKCKQE